MLILLNPSEQDLPVVSFGFTCKRADEAKRQYYDNKVKHTIIHIIKMFFDNQKEIAVLYLCVNKMKKPVPGILRLIVGTMNSMETSKNIIHPNYMAKWAFMVQSFSKRTIPVNNYL